MRMRPCLGQGRPWHALWPQRHKTNSFSDDGTRVLPETRACEIKRQEATLDEALWAMHAETTWHTLVMHSRGMILSMESIHASSIGGSLVEGNTDSRSNGGNGWG